MDATLGHLVFSMKYDVIGDQEHLRLMLRYSLNLVFLQFYAFLIVSIRVLFTCSLLFQFACVFLTFVPISYTNLEKSR